MKGRLYLHNNGRYYLDVGSPWLQVMINATWYESWHHKAFLETSPYFTLIGVNYEARN